jgi:hypothetical protein
MACGAEIVSVIHEYLGDVYRVETKLRTTELAIDAYLFSFFDQGIEIGRAHV